ncbi:hypothetical protein QEG98_36000 [Myxococcus sp. MxC21-1]|uniref:hypothetical protein n=1 Tax=Myxococcus sp. MxC21-1 TaxID=3041439 RepID=UPI002930756C|nr:hypothetical protein [Myxococcus sp. MxC21-1]WNZ61250.1 hypothetical protein QEG98_36000 [Myxococcus sp. MxC21-1]
MQSDNLNIVFLIDSKKLPKGGATINTATAVAHPPFLLNGTLEDPEFKVPVPSGKTVCIYTEEANHDESVKIAPTGIIAHSFRNVQLKVADMKDPATRPIDIPNFDMDPGPVPDFIAYSGDDVQWTPAPSSWSNWANNPLIDETLTPGMKRTYIPFVTFRASTIVSGEFQYGMVFGLTKDGTNVEYFYFDPYLVIGS